MMRWVLALAVIAGLMAFGFAWDRDRAFHEPMNEVSRSSQRLDAAKAGQPEPDFSQPWYERNPVLFGGAVGIGVFLVGTLVVIAQNTSAQPAASGVAGDEQKPPATSV